MLLLREHMSQLPAGVTGLILAAGILTVAAGWWFKFSLIRRAAFTQGLALPHLPVRGRGQAGPAIRPGWNAVRTRQMAGGS